MVLECRHRLGHRGVLLPDGHVDALHTQAGLVDDGVDRHRGLAGLAVADDELPLTAADRGHGVDRLDAGLKGLAHRLAADDPGSLDLHTAGLGGRDRALPVEGLAQGVDHTAEQGVTDGHRLDAPGCLDRLLLFEVVHLTEDDRADGVLVEVESQAERAVLELEQLVHGRSGQARHAGDAVADLHDPTDLLGADRRGVVLDVALERPGDLAGVDRQLCHHCAPSVCALVVPRPAAPNPAGSQLAGTRCSRRASIRPTRRGVHLQVTDADQRAAEERLVDHHLQLDRRPRQGAQRLAEAAPLLLVDGGGGTHVGDAPTPGLRGLLDQIVQRADDVARPPAGDGVARQHHAGSRDLALEQFGDDTLTAPPEVRPGRSAGCAAPASPTRCG